MEYHKQFTKEIEKITNKPFAQSGQEFLLYDTYDEWEGECLCGKDLHKLFTIKHKDTNKEYIIGSDCIERLNKQLKKKVDAIEYCKTHTCNFDKHKGKKWSDVLAQDRQYVGWLVKYAKKHKVAIKHLGI